MKKTTAEWIAKAEIDFAICKRESVLKPVFPGEVCFHAQQCIEKYLKAIMSETGGAIKKTHDLLHLVQQCLHKLSDLAKFVVEFKEISVFAVESRYPGLEATMSEAKKSLKVAEAVRKIVRNHLRIRTKVRIKRRQKSP